VCKKHQPKSSEEVTTLKSQFTNLGTCFIDLEVPSPSPTRSRLRWSLPAPLSVQASWSLKAGGGQEKPT
jgi:hypothetical protein